MGLVKSEADPKILEFKESRPREKSSLPQMGRRLRLFAIANCYVADLLSFLKIFLSLHRCHWDQGPLLKWSLLVALYRSSFVL